MSDAQTPKRPNILWVSFEDTFPFYGCYGDLDAKTPTLDKMAQEGCLFTNAFSSAGVCAPARCGVITGMYPNSIGGHHMRTTHTNSATPELPTPYDAVPPHMVKCFSEYLRAAGYYCSNNVKTDYQFKAPLTAWDDCSGEGHWRNRKDKDQPFFAVFNPCNTHESAEWESATKDITFDPDTLHVPEYLPDTPKVRLALAKMHTQISRSDQFLADRIRELKEDGLFENTIIMHWSDHGPLPRGKRWLYDAGIHVPLIIYGAKELDVGTVSDRMISTIDLGPTVLSLAGIPVPPHMHGRAFLGAQAKPEREYIFAARDRFDEAYDKVRAARTKQFKYIRNDHPELPYHLWIPYLNNHPIHQEMWRLHLEGKLDKKTGLMFEPRPVEELYYVSVDPNEVNNLSADPAYAETLAKLRQATIDWTNEVGDLGCEDEYQMVRRWWPDGHQPKTAAPVAIPFDATLTGIHPCGMHADALIRPVELKYPCEIQFHSATQGASIAYQLINLDVSDKPENDKHWELYSKPLKLKPGRYRMYACATRIGFKASDRRPFLFTVS